MTPSLVAIALRHIDHAFALFFRRPHVQHIIGHHRLYAQIRIAQIDDEQMRVALSSTQYVTPWMSDRQLGRAADGD